MVTSANDYSKREETLNIATHGFGLILSIPASIFMIVYTSLHGNLWQIVSSCIYSVSLITLYLASTTYHSAKTSELRKRLNVFDHSAIYLLIAGTYTPFLLVTLKGSWGWSLFGVVWGFALVGILMKIFFSARYKIVSAIAYVAMGWIIVIAIKPLIANLDPKGLLWLIIGGLSYTIGAFLYVFKKIPYNHAIFHVFVLIGSFTHWIAVFYYVM